MPNVTVAEISHVYGYAKMAHFIFFPFELGHFGVRIRPTAFGALLAIPVQVLARPGYKYL